MPSEEQLKVSAKLFWNVQFIYELELAKKELEAFNIRYKLKNNLRDIDITFLPDGTEFLDRAAYFEELGGKLSLYSKITKANVTKSLNQYLTHWIYPYKGKYHPQMIRALLNIMRIQPGKTILDPFVGSGTTAVEAQLLGINCKCIDISEVCTRVTQVKTQAHENLENIITIFERDFIDLKKKVQQNALNEEEINKIESKIEKIKDSNVYNFFKVASLIAHSDRARRKKKSFTASFLKNVEKMILSLKDYQKIISEYNLKLGSVSIEKGDAKQLQLPPNSIDGIICSPPYSIALNYVENDKHALDALGFDTNVIKEEFIGVRGTGKTKIDLYNQDLIQSYKEMDRVLKTGKYCSIVIGNATVDKKEVKTVEYTIDVFQNMGYTLEENIDKIIFGLYNVMQKENILVFKKP